ncbi:MAG: hypothetical protein SGJ15_07390 [Bacteroidota bacterium]|nr:hypothetical protein [Bacteroidota bacterium]
MQIRRLTFILFISILFSDLNAQEHTIDHYKSSEYKIGGKLISEKSGLLNLTPFTFFVYGGGVQIIKRIRLSRLSFESGVYIISKAAAEEIHGMIFHSTFYNISVPLNLRFDTKYIYISAGSNADYFFKQGVSKWYISPLYDFRKFTFGANINLGFQYKLFDRETIFLEFRYSKTVTSPAKTGPYYNPNFTNFGLAIGFNYDLGKRGKKKSI